MINGRQVAKKKAIEYGMKFICEKCGSSKNVDIHHRDGNELNNIKENLVMLCRSHHLLTHSGEKAKTTFNCEYCNKLVIRYKTQLSKGHKFCSFYCRQKWYIENKGWSWFFKR